MRILVIGAGRVGARVLRQLQKNPALTIITADPRPEPFALQAGIIEAVDISETLTPFTLDYIVASTQPDLVLLTRATEDMGLGMAPGMDLLVESLRQELTALSEVPMIVVSRTAQ